jgi:hypothetical protein
MKQFNEYLTEQKTISQLEKGIKVEQEHKSTYNKIKDYYEKNKSFPDEKDVYKWIAEDHIKEISDYYTRLEKMEKGKC